MFLEGFFTAALFFMQPQILCDIDTKWDHLIISHTPFVVGLLIGGYLFGALSDANGRKYSIHISSMLCFVSSFMLAASSIFLLLDISKFLLGMSLAGIKGGCHVVVFEALPPNYRGSRLVLLDVISSLGVAMAIALSNHVMTGKANSPLVLRLRFWRLIVVIAGLLCLFGSTLLGLIPVSARQMAAHQRLISSSILLRRICAIHHSISEESVGHFDIDPFIYVERRRSRLQHSHGVIYFFGRCVSYTYHLFRMPKMIFTVILLLLHACFFDGTILLNSWVSERLERGGKECILHGARAMNETEFNEMCLGHESHNFYFNVYMALASSLALILLPLIIDRFPRRIIMMFSSLLCAGTIFTLFYPLGKAMDVITGLVAVTTHSVAMATLSVVTLENYPTKFRATALGLLSIAGKVVNIGFSFVWQGRCSQIFPVISYFLLGAALFSVCLPNLNNKRLKE